MNRNEWKDKIRTACEEAGTYRPFFDSAIDTLSGILEKRDDAEEKYWASGGNPVITHTNKAKETNIVKNPILMMLNDLNAQALTYWRDLGLTPAGYKKLNADVVENKRDGFEKLLEKVLDD